MHGLIKGRRKKVKNRILWWLPGWTGSPHSTGTHRQLDSRTNKLLQRGIYKRVCGGPNFIITRRFVKTLSCVQGAFRRRRNLRLLSLLRGVQPLAAELEHLVWTYARTQSPLHTAYTR